MSSVKLFNLFLICFCETLLENIGQKVRKVVGSEFRSIFLMQSGTEFVFLDGELDDSDNDPDYSVSSESANESDESIVKLNSTSKKGKNFKKKTYKGWY